MFSLLNIFLNAVNPIKVCVQFSLQEATHLIAALPFASNKNKCLSRVIPIYCTLLSITNTKNTSERSMVVLADLNKCKQQRATDEYYWIYCAWLNIVVLHKEKQFNTNFSCRKQPYLKLKLLFQNR